jgi:hypothetical protein
LNRILWCMQSMLVTHTTFSNQITLTAVKSRGRNLDFDSSDIQRMYTSLMWHVRGCSGEWTPCENTLSYTILSRFWIDSIGNQRAGMQSVIRRWSLSFSPPLSPSTSYGRPIGGATAAKYLFDSDIKKKLTAADKITNELVQLNDVTCVRFCAIRHVTPILVTLVNRKQASLFSDKNKCGLSGRNTSRPDRLITSVH